jgi:8-oxo-dGTP pyrophosphatase MutT (NUDIX family)
MSGVSRPGFRCAHEQPPEIAVFVVRGREPEVLLLRRAPAEGAYWHVVAGRIEPGETAAAAAERELLEETGLVADMDRPLCVTERATIDGLPAGSGVGFELDVSCFVVRVGKHWEPTLNEEHDAFRWLSVPAALEALIWPGTAYALKMLVPSASSPIS